MKDGGEEERKRGTWWEYSFEVMVDIQMSCSLFWVEVQRTENSFPHFYIRQAEVSKV